MKNFCDIAVVGAGLIGQRHVDAIERSDHAQPVCVVDPAPAAQDFARDRGLAHAHSLPEMLARFQPDGVIVATPNALHIENAALCVDAGVPVLIEKPIADDSASAADLVVRAETAGVPVLVGHHRRHNPIIQEAKAQINAGKLGDIVAVNASCWLYKPAAYFETKWRSQKGAGPIFINLIHDIDLLRYLVGEVQSVQAIQSSHQRQTEVEDTAAILLRFQSGALATLSVSDTIVAPHSWELTAAENPAYPATGQNCYTIGGTRGTMELPSGRIWTQDDPRSWWEPINQSEFTVAAQDPLDLQISHFCDVIRGAATPLVSGAEGLASLRVIEAIKQSAHDGVAVTLVPRHPR